MLYLADGLRAEIPSTIRAVKVLFTVLAIFCMSSLAQADTYNISGNISVAGETVTFTGVAQWVLDPPEGYDLEITNVIIQSESGPFGPLTPGTYVNGEGYFPFTFDGSVHDQIDFFGPFGPTLNPSIPSFQSSLLWESQPIIGGTADILVTDATDPVPEPSTFLMLMLPLLWMIRTNPRTPARR